MGEAWRNPMLEALKRLGFAVSPMLLARADEVIE